MSAVTDDPKAPPMRSNRIGRVLAVVAPSTESAKPRASLSWVRQALESLIAVLVVIGTLWFVLLQHETRTMRRQISTAADSLVLARKYQSLMTEVLDLETELHARQVGRIGPDVDVLRLPRPGKAPSSDIRPVPAFSSVYPDTSEQRRAQSLLATASPPSTGVTIVFHQPDVKSSGALMRLRVLGFRVAEAGQERGGPSTSLTLGPDVSPAHARLAGLALLASGIDVKRIRRSPDPTLRGKISITFSSPLLDWPGLRVDDVERMTSNPRGGCDKGPSDCQLALGTP